MDSLFNTSTNFQLSNRQHNVTHGPKTRRLSLHRY